MLLPSEMSKITILAHKSNGDKLVEALHESGLMEIERVSVKGIEEGKIHPDAGLLASYDLRLGRILEILKGYAPRKKGIKNLLKKKVEKKKVKKRSMEEKIREAEKLLEEIEQTVLENERRINEIEEEIEFLRAEEKKLEYLALFDINVEWLGKSKYLIIKFGISTDLSSLEEKNIDFYYRKIGEKKENKWAVLIVAHSSMEEEVNKIKNFEEIKIEGEGRAKELLKEIRRKIRDALKEKEEIRKRLAKIYRQRRLELLAVKEEIEIEKERKEVYRNFGETLYTFLIEGWCLAEHAEKVRQIVEEATDGNNAIFIKKAKRNPDEPPIHLENPKWAKPFETFLELFALPKYNEINPTVFLGIAFVIFFSMMLGDAGYGMVIFLLSLAAYIKFKESEFIRSWSFVGIWLGLGNMITGFLFNSFFGDFIPRFIYGDATKMIYNAEIFGISLPIDAIHKPVLILSIALILGLAHLNVGFILAVYKNLKRGHVKDIFIEQIPWFMLEIGGGMLIGETLLELWQLSSIAKMIAGIFTVIGLISLFKRNGALGFFEITGFLGDWLSYARLLALGLATAGMALAFNVIAELLPDIIPYVGIVLVPILLVVAHFANLLIQSLGAAIHSLRLQYVEFFNRFYEGGGKKFMPFQIRRKYTEEIK
jgi:V/A-type H+-transporting ATPase subunit I